MTSLDIGPGELSEPGVQGGPNFILSRPEWIKIQVFVQDALVLPTTQSEFRNSLGPGAPNDLSDFTKLINVYRLINDDGKNWRDSIYPKAISVASNILQYGRDKVPVYYPPIKDLAQRLMNNPNDQQAKNDLKSVLKTLRGEADKQVQWARLVSSTTFQFAYDIETDKTTLVGTDGNGGLVAYYDKKYGRASQAVADVTKEIADEKTVLKAANDEYNHDVVVASTTPAYAWLGLPGFIAGAVVAGEYGARAVEALKRVKAAKAQINKLEAELAADANLMNAARSAQQSSSTIAQDITAVLPVVQKIEGVWGALFDDLGYILDLIDNNIAQVPPIIMDLGVDAAIAKWAAVAQEAEKFLRNAHVSEQPDGFEQWTVEGWRLATLITPNRVLAGALR
ncbi:alpha-xenorhabdolysin family binary toxin subunit A [Nocardia gipuzkoensis]|uniref:alpha-xenorhabdolysin family binary toxin subunit A n=1 Tax=Nocardia gipuzkoensis TaxID=2749991 RepID=UPI001E5A8866|nr:alpha-xenorhabdolysin family binary toxin subunit A [Nocardia gipuzkoensis]UGT67705.1 alpha-xenorhabdolysin family binary toxin subunit A [Nocardia gipuzkoensis]